MISTNGITLKENLRAILNRYNDELVFRHYIPDFVINKRIRSPLRKDVNPSFSIFLSRSGKLMYHDYANNDSGDVIKFVMMLFGLSYYDALLKIARDLSIIDSVLQKPDIVVHDISRTKKTKVIKVVIQPFTTTDLIYWESYGIRKSTLEHFKVYSIAAVFIDDVLVGEYYKSNPIYGYYLGNGWKIYKPFSKQRFYMNSTVLQGYNQLPDKGDLLIITKSLKDVMLLYELGYHAVAPHGESILNIPEIDDLRDRFTNMVIFFDNDSPGINGAKVLSETYKIPYVYIPEEEMAKDISDYNKINNINKTKELIEKLVCQKVE